jgi:cytochrome P450
MTDVDALELPEFDPADTELHGDEFHRVMADLAERSWLVRIPLGYMTLDREAGEFFLRMRKATIPGQMIAELFGIESGPLRDEIDRNILHIDGDDHRRLRNLLNPFFTPRAANRWRPVMRDLLGELFAGVEDVQHMEFVQTLAKPYPSLTIATMMGAPREDAPRLYDWSNWIQRQFDGPSLLAQRERIEQAVEEFYAWCNQLLAHRRESPSDDLISLLIAEQGGDRITDVELVNLVLNVLVGAVDTTQSQLSHAIRLFASHPDQWRILGRETERAPQAVDEILRHEPATPFTARILTEPVTYRDVTFPAGTVVMVCSFTGNRDGDGESTFDITTERETTRLMTFGAGIHYCVGANIARAELEEALAFLAPRMPNLRLDGEPRFGTIQGIYGLEVLPIAWGNIPPGATT